MLWPKAHREKLLAWRVRLPHAFYSRKTCFWGWSKTRFSGITFFLVDMEESGQSNVCRASDARNFGTKFVEIEALWPRLSPVRKLTRPGPINFPERLQLFWLDRLSWFWCHSIRHSPTWFPTIRNFLIPGFPGPLWPAKLKNGHFWLFLDFSTNKKYANVKIGDSQIEGLSTSFNLIPNLLR